MPEVSISSAPMQCEGLACADVGLAAREVDAAISQGMKMCLSPSESETALARGDCHGSNTIDNEMWDKVGQLLDGDGCSDS